MNKKTSLLSKIGKRVRNFATSRSCRYCYCPGGMPNIRPKPPPDSCQSEQALFQLPMCEDCAETFRTAFFL